MKSILYIGTGGTIACLPTEEGLAPALPARDLLPYTGLDAGGIDCLDLFSLDSSNIQPEEWRVMAREVNRAVAGYAGVVITHGTDTMAYTAAMLTFMLQNLPIPLVLTGSQLPMVLPDSDGRRNLRDAILAARKLPGGVYICFGGSVMLGSRAVKVRTTSFNAFESVNYPYIGVSVNNAFVKLNNPPFNGGVYNFNDSIEPNVALIKLVPGATPALFAALPGCGYKGLVVEAFGLGGVHSIRRDHTDAIARLIMGGMPVVLSSQCLYESSAPGVYEVSRALMDAGILSAGDMTTEAAVTKLMWALGQESGGARVRDILHKNLAGEITCTP